MGSRGPSPPEPLGSSATSTTRGIGSATGSAETTTEHLTDRPAALLAIDVGGTKVAAAVVTVHGEVLERSQVPTLRDGTADELFDAVVSLAGDVVVAADVPVDRCGVGCGGPMDGDTVSPLNIPAWRAFPLRRRLSESLSMRVSVDNDAKAIALAEGWLGAARGRCNYLAMVVSTGVGGGIVLDGRLLDGRTTNAGHVGHVIVEPDGRACACGSHGCLEAEASGLAIEAVTGAPAALASVEVIERTGTLVGRAVASVAHLLDLDLAVVGGSVALGFGAPFFAAAQHELSSRVGLSFARAAAIVPAALGADAPLIGAAAVALRPTLGCES